MPSFQAFQGTEPISLQRRSRSRPRRKDPSEYFRLSFAFPLLVSGLFLLLAVKAWRCLGDEVSPSPPGGGGLACSLDHSPSSPSSPSTSGRRSDGGGSPAGNQPAERSSDDAGCSNHPAVLAEGGQRPAPTLSSPPARSLTGALFSARERDLVPPRAFSFRASPSFPFLCLTASRRPFPARAPPPAAI